MAWPNEHVALADSMERQRQEILELIRKRRAAVKSWQVDRDDAPRMHEALHHMHMVGIHLQKAVDALAPIRVKYSDPFSADKLAEAVTILQQVVADIKSHTPEKKQPQPPKGDELA